MKAPIVMALVLTLFSSTGFAKDDHHECEAALDKLKDKTEKDFSNSGHHEF